MSAVEIPREEISPVEIRAFAYADPAHAAVVERTPGERWYGEELFARFAVVRALGTVDGQDLLA